jgi:hypothetical protein
MATLTDLIAEFKTSRENAPKSEGKGGGGVSIPQLPLDETTQLFSVPEDLRDKMYIGGNRPDSNASYWTPEFQNMLNKLQYEPNNRNFAATDLSRGGKYPNLNNRSANETLRLQRMVDRINNRVYLKPGQTGLRIYGRGTSVDRAATLPEVYQMPKIETEDTRQMTAMRGWEDAVRKAEIARQQGWQDVELTMQEAWLKSLQQRAANMTDSDIAKERDAYSMDLHLYQLHASQAYAKAFDKFSKYVTANLARDNAQIALNMWITNPTYGTVVAQLLQNTQTLPSMTQKLEADYFQALATAANRDGTTPEAALRAIMAGRMDLLGSNTAAILESATSQMPEFLDLFKQAAAQVVAQVGLGQ